GDDGLERRPADLLELKDLAHVLDHPERHHCARCCVRRPRNLLCGNTRSPIAATRGERRLEYHVEYLMVFWASNAAATANFRRPKLRARCWLATQEAHMFRPLIARVMVAAAIATCLLPPLAQAQERDLKFVLDFISLGRHAPWYVALGKGYFKDEGLNVT